MRGFFIIEITINLIQRNLNFLAEILPVFNKSSKKIHLPAWPERRKMTYCQFVQEVKEKVKEGVEADQSVTLYTSVKNNGVKRTGLMFSEQGINVAPAIYLESFYEDYQKGQRLEDVADEILVLYGKVKADHSWEEDCFQCYEKVRDRIVFRLINRKANEELLKTIPYVPYLDLAVVFYVVVDVNVHGTVSLLIREPLRLEWKVSVKELYDQALQNTPSLFPYEFRALRAVIEEVFPSDRQSEEEYMYVLSNRFQSFGAAAILYPNRLKQIGCVMDDDYYVLPSSVHEVLIVPAEYVRNRQMLDEMVREVNQVCVEEEEILSDHAYYYDRSEDLLTM